MEKNKSIQISGYISQSIIKQAIKIDYTKDELCREYEKLDEKQLQELERAGLYDGDFEKYYVIKKLCDRLDLWKYADDEYMKKLFSEARKLDRKSFYENDYLKNIKVPTISKDNVLLHNACYEKGEFLQYDMPKLSSDIVVPKLAFFDSDVYFPSVYEGNMPWVSVCPSEINSMDIDIDKAVGRCLVLGLGLGYYPYMISKLENVKKITVVEISEKIIELFKEHILPQFENKEKIRIVHADAIEYMKQVEREEYDYCYADIWEGQADGAPLYKAIKKHEKRLPYTRFAYWIEDEIKWYIDQTE